MIPHNGCFTDYLQWKVYVNDTCGFGFHTQGFVKVYNALWMCCIIYPGFTGREWTFKMNKCLDEAHNTHTHVWWCYASCLSVCESRMDTRFCNFLRKQEVSHLDVSFCQIIRWRKLNQTEGWEQTLQQHEWKKQTDKLIEKSICHLNKTIWSFEENKIFKLYTHTHTHKQIFWCQET